MLCFTQAVNAASKSAQMRRESDRSDTIEVDDVVLEENMSSSTEGDDKSAFSFKVLFLRYHCELNISIKMAFMPREG